MKNRTRVAIVALTLAVLSIIAWAKPANAPTTEETASSTPAIITPAEPEKKILSHRQDTWIRALEWCESRGETGAVNEIDRDGTPSYYAFQFKPGTFRSYGTLYGIIAAGIPEKELMELLKDRDLQYAIVSEMVLDYDSIDWRQQFPGCVRLLGMPPRS